MDRSQYLIWWWLAEKWPQHQKMCETMARLVCHASRLKSDDFRYKGASQSTLQCQYCDLGVVENVVHLVMQCPAFEDKRRVMLENVGKIDDMIRLKCTEEPGQVVLLWLLGKIIEGVKEDNMV